MAFLGVIQKNRWPNSTKILMIVCKKAVSNGVTSQHSIVLIVLVDVLWYREWMVIAQKNEYNWALSGVFSVTNITISQYLGAQWLFLVFLGNWFGHSSRKQNSPMRSDWFLLKFAQLSFKHIPVWLCSLVLPMMLLSSMKTCYSVKFYFMKNSFSDISRKWILPNMIRAGTILVLYCKIHYLLTSEN